MARNDGGIGKADPWPTTDTPIVDTEPSRHYTDGYHNRLPLGGHNELPTDYWLDSMVYPKRPEIGNGEVSAADISSRRFGISIGNATGKKPGPSFD